MRAAYVTKGVDHGQDDEAEGRGDAGVRYGATRGIIDHECARAGENEPKRAQRFGNEGVSSARPFPERGCGEAPAAGG